MPGHNLFEFKFDFNIGDIIYSSSLILYVYKKSNFIDTKEDYKVHVCVSGKGKSFYTRKDLCKMIQHKGFRLQSRKHLSSSIPTQG